jgi:hypothetical protein
MRKFIVTKGDYARLTGAPANEIGKIVSDLTPAALPKVRSGIRLPACREIGESLTSFLAL